MDRSAAAMFPARLLPFRRAAQASYKLGVGRMPPPVAKFRQHRSALPVHFATRNSSDIWLTHGSGPIRLFASQSSEHSTVLETPPLPPTRWLADLRSRVGKCIMFGCSAEQILEAAVVARALATEWRRLTAGSEGYLTGGRRGLQDQKVVWGEMDSFVRKTLCLVLFPRLCFTYLPGVDRQ